MRAILGMVALSLAAPGLGISQEPEFYLGAGASFAQEAFETIGADDTNGWDLLAGYRPDPHWAVEGQIGLLQPFDLDPPRGDGSIKTNSYTVAGKVFPLTGSVQPFLSAGLGLVYMRSHITTPNRRISNSETEWAGVFGGGLDFEINRNLILEGQLRYFLPKDDLSHLDYWTAGVNAQFRF